MTIKPILPFEVVQLVIEDLHASNDKRTLAACALVDRAFHAFVAPLLYHTVHISTPLRYSRFAHAASPAINTLTADWHMLLVRELNFSGYTTLGTRRSDASKIVNTETLMDIFAACLNVERIVMTESIEKAVTSDVLKTIMFNCRQLKSLEFMGMSSPDFSKAMLDLVSALDADHDVVVESSFSPWSTPSASPFSSRRNSLENSAKQNTSTSALVLEATQILASQPQFPAHIPITLPPTLQTLALHHCPTLSDSTILHPLLAHLSQCSLARLDLTGTKLTDRTLLAHANLGATLTHLALSKCKNLSAEAIVQFISGCKRLEYLNLYSDPTTSITNGLGDEDLFDILNSLPKTIRHVDVGSAMCTETASRAIARFTPNLEKLGIAGANVAIPELERLLAGQESLRNLVSVDLSNIPSLTAASAVQLTSFLAALKAKSNLHAVEVSKEVYVRAVGYTTATSGRREWIMLRDDARSCENLLERKVLSGEAKWRGAKAAMSSAERYYGFSF